MHWKIYLRKIRCPKFGKLSVTSVNYFVLSDINAKKLLTRMHAQSLASQWKLDGNL